MTTAAVVAYAYDQIDQARAELNAVSVSFETALSSVLHTKNGRWRRQPIVRLHWGA
jgi:hypothetical protein